MSADRVRRVAPVSAVLPPLVALGVLVGIWELISLHDPFVLPSVPSIVSELAHNKALFAKDALTTIEETVIGLAMGFAGALVVAVAMSQVRVVERAIMPLAIVLNVTPLVALAPGFAIALGFGIVPKFVVTAIIVFFPFLMNLLAGLNSAEIGALEVLRSVGASRAEVLWRVQLPSSLPFAFVAARICFPLSLVGAVVAELTVSGQAVGLGAEISVASAQGQLPAVYASVLCLAAIGTALFLVVVLAERRMLGWYRATRGSRR